MLAAISRLNRNRVCAACGVYSRMTEERSNLESAESPADWDALARYLAAECSPGEAAAVKQWLEARPHRAALVAALDRVIPASTTPSGLDVEAALGRVHQRMDEADVRPIAPRIATGRSISATAPWRGWGLRAAAVIAFVLGGAVLFRAVRSGSPSSAETSWARTITTAVGQRDSTMLPDGSRVLLGPGSELRIASGFADTKTAREREVSLRGEAFFDVVHDAARPFVVRAGGAVIRDVGTTFVVHSDAAEGVRVVVTSGAVQLSVAGAGDNGVVLRPTDRATLEPAGRVTIDRGSATDADLAWTRGQLVFRDAPIPQVVADLRRWYGIELRPADSSLAGRHYNGAFSGRESRQEILRSLLLAFDAKGELRGDTIELHDARGPATMPR